MPESYIERPLKDSDVIRPQSDVRIEVTELGNETVDGHPCVKNKVVETDKKGRRHEYTVWNATDLKKFPVKIETGVQTGEQRSTVTILIKDVKLGAPDAALFEPPAAKKANALTLLLDLTKLMRSMKNDRSITNSN